MSNFPRHVAQMPDNHPLKKRWIEAGRPNIPSPVVPAKRTEIKDLAVTIGHNQAFIGDANPGAVKVAAQVKNLTIQINRILNFIKETQEGKQ